MSDYRLTKTVQTDVFAGMKLRMFFYMWMATLATVWTIVNALYVDDVQYLIASTGLTVMWTVLAWRKLCQIEAAIMLVATNVNAAES